MEKLKFYDLRGKKSFMSSKYEIKKIKGRNMAICKAPSGVKSYRIVSKK